MAVQIINTVLKAENDARKQEEKALEYAKTAVEEAKVKADEILKDALRQAETESETILKEADETVNGILQNAQKLAAMRKKKVISDTEKEYQSAIRIVIDNII